MRVLSAEMIKLSRKKLPFERLEVDVDLASEMFQENKYKSQQIPEIALSSNNQRTVTLYRVGDFIDVSKGPMMSHTGHLNKCTITAVHPLPQASQISNTLYRIQGIGLPSGFLVSFHFTFPYILKFHIKQFIFQLNHFAYGIIEQRGRKFNAARIPGTIVPAIASSEELPEKARAAAHG